MHPKIDHEKCVDVVVVVVFALIQLFPIAIVLIYAVHLIIPFVTSPFLILNWIVLI
jgi:hypothetical protein